MGSRLNSEQIDVLTEVVTIGAGNAATALSQMLGKKVTIDIPSVNACSIEEASQIFGAEEQLITTIFMEMLGDISGAILFSFQKDEVNRFADLMLGFDKGKTKLLNEMAVSALKETSTILSGAYLNAISKLLGFRILLTTPGFAQDMAGAIVDAILAEVSKEADLAIVMDTELLIIDEKVLTYFFFIPDVDSLKKIISKMGIDSSTIS